MTESVPEAMPKGTGKDADGVPEEALTAYAVYDLLELRYLDGTYASLDDAKSAVPSGEARRYKVRRV